MQTVDMKALKIILGKELYSKILELQEVMELIDDNDPSSLLGFQVFEELQGSRLDIIGSAIDAIGCGNIDAAHFLLSVLGTLEYHTQSKLNVIKVCKN